MTIPTDTALSRIVQSEHVIPLSKRDFGYLQVVLSEFELHRTSLARVEAGRLLKVAIPDDPPTIVRGEGKREIESQARAEGSPGVASLQTKLDEFESNPNLLAYRFDCSEWPMRFANGGVLPVIHLDGRDYFLMFYRDIFPIGWNIANGASDNTEEWLDPSRIIQREFGEEVLMCDPVAKRLFIHSPPGDTKPVGFHEDAIKLWSKKWPELAQFEKVPMPLKWIDGPDAVHVSFRGRSHDSKGVFLSVTPPDHGIEVDRVGLVRLSGDIRFLDGEIVKETLMNHVVGLFDVKCFHGLSGNHFLPDRVFFDGQEHDPQQLENAIRQFLNHVQSSGLRRPDQVQDYQQASERFNLCPITRAVIKRYFEWLKQDQQRPPQQPGSSSPTKPRDGRPPEVFISHRSTHVSHARALHDYLTNLGHSVFFSDETLASGGTSDYERAIGQALDQSKVLVLLALDPKDLESGWVDFEWKAFNCELLSGRKKGEMFTLLHDVNIDQLPVALRIRQSIKYSPTSPFDSFDNLYRYLGPALAKSNG